VLYQLSYFRDYFKKHLAKVASISSWGKVVLYQLSYFRNERYSRKQVFLFRDCKCRHVSPLFKGIQEIFLKNLCEGILLRSANDPKLSSKNHEKHSWNSIERGLRSNEMG
jgi:hypothetical protein